MNESVRITTERADDIPLLLAQMERMGVPRLMDEHFPAHGNWRGVSVGWVVTLWLSYILSRADHRLNQVQGWAEQRLETLRRCTGQPVRALDLSDDRLAGVLEALADDRRWAAWEGAMTGHLVRVYDLRPQRVRLDSTTASGYWEVTEDGLFQFGHSKDHRPDLPQVKVMLATLDPLGLPVATDVLSGERADDPLYLPAIARVRASLGQTGLLYVGDCKMAALETRASVQAAGDFYLCPLPATQITPEALAALLAPVAEGTQALTPIVRTAADGQERVIAEGFEQQERLSVQVAGQEVTWDERRLIVRSPAHARAAEQALRARLAQAQAALAALNVGGRGKRRLPDRATAEQAVAAILTRYQMGDLLRVTVTEESVERPMRGYRGRPATVRQTRQVHVTAQGEEAALATTVQRLGWRVYAATQPATEFSLAQAVLAYRDEYLVEHGLGRLKGQPLALTPLYLERDDHATGLIRLLAIALRVLTVVEFVVRRRLAQTGALLTGLYAGNPRRTTARPTAERLLEAFGALTLTMIHTPQQVLHHLSPLSALQQRILALLDLPPDTYTRLAALSVQPP
ncbi:MAG: IS1634 family transposase [Streptosporangiaceae bacterium]